MLVLGGSVVAVAVMVAFAWALRLGGGAIAGEAEAMAAAEDLLPGFDAEQAVVGSDGRAALVSGADGSLAVLKMHGARIAGRLLHPPFDSEATAGGLRIRTGDARFGAVTIPGVQSIPSRRGSARSA